MTTSDPYAADSSRQPYQGSPQQFEPEQGVPQPAQPQYATSDYGSEQQPGYAAPTSDQTQYQAPQYDASQYQTQPYTAAPYASTQPSGSSSSGGTDGVSIAALVVSLIGGGVIAIILGALGIKRTAESGKSGAGMAWTGLIIGILGTVAATAAVTWSAAATSTLLDPETWEVEGGTETVWNGDAQAYGDDPALDQLWDACAAGDDIACDDLYSQSPIGSDYEEFGDNCGDRGRPATQLWCEAGRDF